MYTKSQLLIPFSARQTRPRSLICLLNRNNIGTHTMSVHVSLDLSYDMQVYMFKHSCYYLYMESSSVIAHVQAYMPCLCIYSLLQNIAYMYTCLFMHIITCSCYSCLKNSCTLIYFITYVIASITLVLATIAMCVILYSRLLIHAPYFHMIS